ncbi:type III secretion protein HrpT [Enterobacteriaceae bacterium]
MLKRVLMLTAVTLLLSACAKPTTGCLDVSCRPSSDLHRLTIWWQPEMRNGPYDYTQVPVDH